jgi:hypothetical protein
MEPAEELGAVIDVGEAALAGLVHRVDACGEVRRWGFSSTSVWLQRTLGMRKGRVQERTALARQLARLGETANRFRSGGLSYGYAATVCQAVCRLDDRDHAQRTADALFWLLPQGHERATVTVIIDLDLFYGGSGSARLLGGGRISARRARELALSAGVSALILGAGGRPLYLGRSRFASPSQRRSPRPREAARLRRPPRFRGPGR